MPDAPTGLRAPLAPPSGVRDLLPAEARHRRVIADRLHRVFSAHGYEPVVTPAFEHAEVLARGLDQVDPRELLRFVEPDTGDVALLRPDLTPQVARIVATRLRRRPAPWRISYQGTAIRRRRGRSRRSRQLAQAGVECLGLDPVFADLEVTALAGRALEAVGLPAFRLEIGHVGLGREALEPVPEPVRAAAAETLARKDVRLLDDLLRAHGVPAGTRRTLAKLATLHGDARVLDRARRSFPGRAAGRALDHLARVVDALGGLGLGDRVGIDLGELRGLRYYTGIVFAAFAAGPGEAIVTGGRYDQLLAAFGLPAPATGFAVDLDHVAWALDRAGAPPTPLAPPRLVLGGEDAAAAGLADRLRALGAHVSRVPTADRRRCLAFATAWGYDVAVTPHRGRLRAERTGGDARRVDPGAPDAAEELLAWLRPTTPAPDRAPELEE